MQAPTQKRTPAVSIPGSFPSLVCDLHHSAILKKWHNVFVSVWKASMRCQLSTHIPFLRATKVGVMGHIQKQQIENRPRFFGNLMVVAILVLAVASCGRNETQQLGFSDQSDVVSSRSNINPLPF